MREAGLFMAAALLGCAAAPTPDPGGTAARSVARDAADDRPLADGEVSNDRFARRVLYTWVHGTEVGTLREHRRLLIQKEPHTAFSTRLRGLDDDVARQLQGRAFGLMRRAWANPWANALGWGDEPAVGRIPVRVSLADDAVVAKLDPKGGEVRWTFQTVDGQPLKRVEVLAHPERIAAVYYLHPPEPRYGRGGFPARTYVLLNESQIASWELGTARLTSRLERDVAQLEAVSKELSKNFISDAPWRAKLADRYWRGEGEGLLATYARGLSLSSDTYIPSEVGKVIQALREGIVEVKPLTVKDQITFGAPLPEELQAAGSAAPARPGGMPSR